MYTVQLLTVEHSIILRMELWTHQLGLPWDIMLPTDVILAIGAEVQCFALVMQMEFGPLVNHLVIVSIIAVITKILE